MSWPNSEGGATKAYLVVNAQGATRGTCCIDLIIYDLHYPLQ